MNTVLRFYAHSFLLMLIRRTELCPAAPQRGIRQRWRHSRTSIQKKKKQRKRKRRRNQRRRRRRRKKKKMMMMKDQESFSVADAFVGGWLQLECVASASRKRRSQTQTRDKTETKTAETTCRIPLAFFLVFYLDFCLDLTYTDWTLRLAM